MQSLAAVVGPKVLLDGVRKLEAEPGSLPRTARLDEDKVRRALYMS